MKLILIGLCFIGFVASFGKEQEIRVSGKVQCCKRRETSVPSTICLPPLKSEISLIDSSKFLPNENLKTIKLGKSDGQYLLEWKEKKVMRVDPIIKALVYCEENQKVPYEKEYDWTEKGETNIKQDFTIKI